MDVGAKGFGVASEGGVAIENSAVVEGGSVLEDNSIIEGNAVVAGVVYAPAIWVQKQPTVPTDLPPIPEKLRETERQSFRDAVISVRKGYEWRARLTAGDLAEVMTMTASLVTDKGWVKLAEKAIMNGIPAPVAVTQAIKKFVAVFEGLGGIMATRVTDLDDIKARIVAQLLGLPEPGLPKIDYPSILCAQDLSPADTVTLDPRLILACATELGGSTSHSAIIARQLNIPYMVAVRTLGDVLEGEPVLFDSVLGRITRNPDRVEANIRVEQYQQQIKRVNQWRGPGRTQDGYPVPLLANVQDGASARVAARFQTEGIGLLRTELAFLNVSSEPSIGTQVSIYREVYASTQGKVIARTLDIGSDKPLAFVGHEAEANPALGARGLRIGLRHEGLLTRQLDALAKAARAERGEHYIPQVMAPMVARVSEARQFARLARERGMSPGIMVEVPAVALLAPLFLHEVDFLSIGTNDLSQYLMAADRTSPRLASLTDPWQPSLLRLISMTAKAGTAAGKPVGVCGEAAADPLLACVLTGLGISSLSMSTMAVSSVGYMLSQVTLDRCRTIAQLALSASGARDGRARVKRFFDGL